MIVAFEMEGGCSKAEVKGKRGTMTSTGFIPESEIRTT